MDKDGLANFFLGLGIGVGIGMLFAPKSGEETRGLLLDKADEGKEFLKKQTSKLGDSAGDLLDKSRDIIGKKKEDLKENLNDALEAGKQAYRDKVEPTVSSSLS
jgi:gas vesicle protein